VQEEQVRYADLVLLNKIDRIEEKERMRVEISLRTINPSARIVPSRNGEVAPELLSEAGTSGAAARANSDNEHEHDHEHHEHEHEHDHDHEHEHDEKLPHAASTLFVPLAAPVERGTFQRFLGSLPTSVFRAKGFIRLAESPEKLHTFQQVRDQSELLLLPLENGADLPTGLVFIGPHLDEKRIRELASVLAPLQAT
jgi:G3E family GTPase